MVVLFLTDFTADSSEQRRRQRRAAVVELLLLLPCKNTEMKPRKNKTQPIENDKSIKETR